MPRKKKSEETVSKEKPEKAVSKKDTKKTASEQRKPKTAKKKPSKENEKKIPSVPAEILTENEQKKLGVGGNGNLIPFSELTQEEQRSIASKGGKASVEARRRKKELREFTKDFLMQAAAPVLQSNMKVLGVETDEMSNLAAMVVRLFSKAVNNGDLNAARTLIEWAGMAPLQQQRENEAIAKMSQVIQLAEGSRDTEDAEEDVVFYLPDNGRPIVTDEDTK